MEQRPEDLWVVPWLTSNNWSIFSLYMQVNYCVFRLRLSDLISTLLTCMFLLYIKERRIEKHLTNCSFRGLADFGWQHVRSGGRYDGCCCSCIGSQQWVGYVQDRVCWRWCSKDGLPIHCWLARASGYLHLLLYKSCRVRTMLSVSEKITHFMVVHV